MAVEVPKVTYHGGFSAVDEVLDGTLVLTPDAVTLALNKALRYPGETGMVALCTTPDLERVEVSAEVTRSKVRDIGLFGLLGALSARQEGSVLMVRLRNGETGYLTVARLSPPELLGKLSSWAREAAVVLA